MTNEIATTSDLESLAVAEIAREEKIFELAQRKAQVYAKSTLVPKAYQNNVGNVMIATNIANRLGADLLLVMQNLYVVHGTPAWSSQFLIGTFNSCGRFTAIKYRFEGKKGSKDRSCVAYCNEKSTGEEIEGPEITMEMAQKEGWSTKAGSKWRTMPEHMLRFRAAAFLIRTTAPEIAMGLHTVDEIEDTSGSSSGLSSSGSLADITAEIKDAEEELAAQEPEKEEMSAEDIEYQLSQESELN